MMHGRTPGEWSREERDRPVTREALWYELDALRRTIETKFALLGRKGERAAHFPERGRERDLFRSTTIALNVLIVVSWTAFVVMVVVAITR